MENANQKINNILIDLFHNILQIEEVILKRNPFKDLTIREIHTIEAVGKRGEGTMSEVAKDIGITVGTLSVSINNLLKKGYVTRKRSNTDRRIVLINLTDKGSRAYRLHRKFHYDLINSTVKGITEEEKTVLLKALMNLNDFCIYRIKSIKSRKR